MEILNLLTEQLGINTEQAKGGSGAIFSLVKEKLGDGDFGKIAEVVPGMDDLLASAPQSGGGGGLGGMAAGLASKLGGGVGGLGSLVGAFKSLDLDSGMVGKFVPVILSYVQSKGGDSIKSLLEGVLG
ncbi:MAG: DUF2780 domain-containing protein [Xanthomonadaceae bacterium]|nr:DUF2780 domain-containing protein [Xanthomonadaceae bacterium]